jgi:FkbM family methyltransferase
MTALNGRPWWLIRRNLVRPSNYRALAGSLRVYEQPLGTMRSYFLGDGAYPEVIGVRTPLGRREVTAFGSHDVITIHEVFCRRDYRCAAPPRVVLDVGSNIGVSALYFLTRSPATRCVLYEPVPTNVGRLRSNLLGLESRFEVHTAAVAPTAGTCHFLVEDTGRYGHLVGEDDTEEALRTIEVDVRDVNDVVERTLSDHGRIDLLKLDTEGLELDTVRAISPELLPRIGQIAIEWFGTTEPLADFHPRRIADVINYVR